MTIPSEQVILCANPNCINQGLVPEELHMGGYCSICCKLFNLGCIRCWGDLDDDE